MISKFCPSSRFFCLRSDKPVATSGELSKPPPFFLSVPTDPYTTESSAKSSAALNERPFTILIIKKLVFGARLGPQPNKAVFCGQGKSRTMERKSAAKGQSLTLDVQGFEFLVSSF